jgi:hypothetical protein
MGGGTPRKLILRASARTDFENGVATKIAVFKKSPRVKNRVVGFFGGEKFFIFLGVVLAVDKRCE